MWNKIKTEDYIQKNFVISVTKLQGWQYISFHKKKNSSRYTFTISQTLITYISFLSIYIAENKVLGKNQTQRSLLAYVSDPIIKCLLKTSRFSLPNDFYTNVARKNTASVWIPGKRKTFVQKKSGVYFFFRKQDQMDVNFLFQECEV